MSKIPTAILFALAAVTSRDSLPLSLLLAALFPASLHTSTQLRLSDWTLVVWDVVEPKVRALAAGAEKSADVYPAIRYLLAQLGDHLRRRGTGCGTGVHGANV